MATKKRTAPSPVVVLEEWRDVWSGLRIVYDASRNAMSLEHDAFGVWMVYSDAMEKDLSSFSMPVFK